MKIALVSPYDFAYPGGVNHHVSSLEREFTRMGHEVKVIGPTSSPVTQFGDRFIHIGKPRPVPSSGSVARIAVAPIISNRVREVLEEEKFDVIHLHEPLLPPLCTWMLRFSKTANVGTFHAYYSRPSYRWTQPLFTWLYKKWFNRLDVKLAVSQSARDYANKFFPGHYEILPNGIDLQHFCPDVPPVDEFNDGKKNILFVGRLEKRKGADHLLKAYKQVKREIPDCRLLIVGPGTRLRNKYEKRVQKSGLNDVHFIGQVDYKDLPRYYKTADVFCSPATGHESFGVVLLEAMAVGRPIVVSDIPGYASLITNGVQGFLVPPKDEDSLAETLTRVLTNSSLCQQLGAQGIIKAERYSWKRIAARTLEYYHEAIENFQKRKHELK